jgi:hypothetical protein
MEINLKPKYCSKMHNINLLLTNFCNSCFKTKFCHVHIARLKPLPQIHAE